VALTTDTGGLCCQCADGRELSVTIDSASSLGASFLALKLRSPAATSGRLFTLIISEKGPLGANAPEAEFRRLKMWLRTGH
jgi:toxin CptA